MHNPRNTIPIFEIQSKRSAAVIDVCTQPPITLLGFMSLLYVGKAATEETMGTIHGLFLPSRNFRNFVELIFSVMAQKQALQLFNDRQIRTAWDEKEEKWYFSIVDVVAVLTDQPDYQKARKYWNKLKQRLVEEGFEPVTNCHQLKLTASDGKNRLTDVAHPEQVLRIIQSIPSPKAEPFKQWMAEVASERIDQMIDPELSINQAMADYKRLGYSDNWINQRLKSIEIRKDLTDEWKKRGLEDGPQFATLTDIIYRAWSDMSAKEYKRFKGLTKENLRDNMTNKELVLNMLAELSAKEISEAREPDTFEGHMQAAADGGDIARNARLELESQTGKPVISPKNAKNLLQPTIFSEEIEDK